MTTNTWANGRGEHACVAVDGGDMTGDCHICDMENENVGLHIERHHGYPPPGMGEPTFESQRRFHMWAHGEKEK